jgi:hypothetical protein
MKDWLINLFGYICALLIIASMVGGSHQITRFRRARQAETMFPIPPQLRFKIADTKLNDGKGK